MGIGARSLTRLPNKVSRKKKARPSSRAGRDARSGGYIPRPDLAPRWTSSNPWSEQPHSGQFFTVSRVSLVCNVCSRLLPKEWFAERPMASARANSRVPPPRHLCIIMLSPRAPTLTRSLSPPDSSSPPLPSLREVCPLLPPCCCRPATSSLCPPRPLVRPHPLPLSLHPCFISRRKEREKERAKETKRQVKEEEGEREKERKKRNEEKRLGGALCQSG